MPRQIRIEYEGAIYHVLSRGDRREPIFWDEADRQDFLKTLAQTCQKAGFQIHAYCLMTNHFHLVVETPQIRAPHGGPAARGGGSRGMEGAAAGLVSGRREVPERLAAASGRKPGRTPFGRVAAGERTGAGGGDYRGAIEAIGVEGSGVKAEAQERRLQNGAGVAIASRDHVDDWGDRATVAHGKPQDPQQQAPPLEEGA